MQTSKTQTQASSHPEPRMPFGTVVPPTPGEAAALSASWTRRGPLGRLVRIG